MASQIELPDVTLCAADSAFVDLTARALKLSMSQCRFGDAILFSDVAVEGPFRSIKIEPLASVEAYSHFCLRRMADFIETPFALVIQWDGYVVNPQAWANAFRKYDYIGAAWHGVFHRAAPMVGNGGFSLRSRKLLRAVKRLPTVGGYEEDRVICHVFGAHLQQNLGIRFAPVKIADRFSYEFKVPQTTPFGFHGIEHMWRHTDDRELSMAAAGMDIARMDPNKTLRLIHNCVANSYLGSASALYVKLRERYSAWIVEKQLGQTIGPELAAEEMLDLERLVWPRPRSRA